MAKQLSVDEILDQIAGLKEQIRKELIADILSDLSDCAKDGDEDEEAGLQAAIEIIRSNY
jgi:hypothetical protein